MPSVRGPATAQHRCAVDARELLDDPERGHRVELEAAPALRPEQVVAARVPQRLGHVGREPPLNLRLGGRRADHRPSSATGPSTSSTVVIAWVSMLGSLQSSAGPRLCERYDTDFRQNDEGRSGTRPVRPPAVVPGNHVGIDERRQLAPNVAVNARACSGLAIGCSTPTGRSSGVMICVAQTPEDREVDARFVAVCTCRSRWRARGCGHRNRYQKSQRR